MRGRESESQKAAIAFNFSQTSANIIMVDNKVYLIAFIFIQFCQLTKNPLFFTLEINKREFNLSVNIDIHYS